MSDSTMVHQNAFSLMVNIKKGEAENLKDYLKDEDGNTSNDIFPFKYLPSIHFCRMFVVDKLLDIDNKTVTPAQFVFTSNFDNTVEEQYELLASVAPEILDKIFSYCDGGKENPYPSPENRTIETRVNFIRNIDIGTKLFWAGDVGGSVQIVHEEQNLRDTIETFIDSLKQGGKWKTLSQAQIYSKIVAFLKTSEFKWALKPRPKATFGFRFKRRMIFFWKLFVILAFAIFLIIPLLPFMLIVGRILEIKNKNNPPKIIPRPEKEIQEVIESEDFKFQNQLTIYGAVNRPFWFRKTILKMGLFLFRFNGGYKATKGVLSGITTIHFARWVVFDNFKYIMFCSNFDGAWESYLGEFIDGASPGMNLTFGQTYGYPLTKWILGGGAFDEQNFKHVVREHQYTCQVFYTAYPNISIKNRLNNKEIRAGLSKSMNSQELKEWFHRF